MSEFVIKNNVLVKCTGDESHIDIPDGVTKIEGEIFRGVFESCENLTSVTIPDSVKTLGRSAFRGCKKLVAVTVPDSVSRIEEYVFENCTALREVTLPRGLQETPQNGFVGCTALREVTLPDSLRTVSNGTFERCSALSEVTLPTGLKEILSGAFEACESLTVINIPDGVEEIGRRAFKDCRALRKVTLPARLKVIDNWAFDNCSSLTAITVPDSVKTLGWGAFSGCIGLSEITIPDGVTELKEKAFAGCQSLRALSIPASVTAIGERAFFGCDSLTSFEIKGAVKISPDLFGGHFPHGLRPYISTLYPQMTDAAVRDLLLNREVWDTLEPALQTELFIARQGKTVTPAYAKCVTDREALGRALLTALRGKPAAKVFSATAAFMTLFATKVPSATLRALYDALKSFKGASKALASVEQEAAVMERLGEEIAVDDSLPAAEKAIVEWLKAQKRSPKDLQEAVQKAYSIKPSELPKITYKNGTVINPTVWMYLLTAHEYIGNRDVSADWNKPGIRPEAAAVVAELNAASLQKGLLALAKAYLGLKGNNKKMYLAYPICRYADEATMAALTGVAPTWRSTVSGNNAPSLYTFRQASLYSETRAAMLFADKYKELAAYARLRGTDADTLRDRFMADVGLDAQNSKTYDLGNQIVTVRLQADLTFLVETADGKITKSLPKKGADPARYEEANADFTAMKKSVKQIVKNRKELLFEEFLADKSRPSEAWQGAYLQNPLLRSVACLLVWEQDGVTFTVGANGLQTADGAAYTVSDKPVKLAHPMTMNKTDLTAWQRYFTKHALKQPFEQVWEPVVDLGSVKEDRYKGCMIPYYRFTGQKKRGITVEDYDFHNQILISVKDCTVKINRIDWARHSISPNDRFEIESFRVDKLCRRTNHVAAYFDRITVYGRIAKDDPSVATFLPQFTLAQITDFIRIASENNATAVQAILLDYKQKTYADFDPMEEFTLE